MHCLYSMRGRENCLRTEGERRYARSETAAASDCASRRVIFRTHHAQTGAMYKDADTHADWSVKQMAS